MQKMRKKEFSDKIHLKANHMKYLGYINGLCHYEIFWKVEAGIKVSIFFINQHVIDKLMAQGYQSSIVSTTYHCGNLYDVLAQLPNRKWIGEIPTHVPEDYGRQKWRITVKRLKEAVKYDDHKDLPF